MQTALEVVSPVWVLARPDFRFCISFFGYFVFLLCLLRDVEGRPTLVLRSIAHHPGAIDSEDFQRYFLYLLEQVWTSEKEGNVKLGCQQSRGVMVYQQI